MRTYSPACTTKTPGPNTASSSTATRRCDPRPTTRTCYPATAHHANSSNTTYSVSKFLAGAMGQLHREGLITNNRWKPTGYWTYLGAVSYWSWSADTDPTRRLTWTDYATTGGLDPDTWSLD